MRTGHTVAALAAAVLLTACSPGSTGREHSTDTDRQRAAALRADPLLAGAPVEVGDAYTGAFPGWHRSRGQRVLTVPPAPPDQRAAAVHRALAALITSARGAGWQVFAARCDPAATPAGWSVHGYRQQDGYTADLQVTARLADRDPTAAAGEITLALLAPYHLDPPDLLGTPPPALGSTCLDGPPRTAAAGTDHPVDADHRD